MVQKQTEICKKRGGESQLHSMCGWNPRGSYERVDDRKHMSKPSELTLRKVNKQKVKLCGGWETTNHPGKKKEGKKLSTPTTVSSFRPGPPCSPDALFSRTHRLVGPVKETQGSRMTNQTHTRHAFKSPRQQVEISSFGRSETCCGECL